MKRAGTRNICFFFLGLIIPFFFSKIFNVVSDKQTTDELNISIFSSRCFVNVLIVTLIDLHEVYMYISFQIPCKFLVGLCASTIHAQRKCLFL